MPSTLQPSNPSASPRLDRLETPRWFTLPVVREIPAPPVQAGSAW